MKQFAKCFFLVPRARRFLVTWSWFVKKLSGVVLGTRMSVACLPLPVSLMVPLISTQVACLILTLKPYDITHLFFCFKIMCALTPCVAKTWSVKINLKLILT